MRLSQDPTNRTPTAHHTLCELHLYHIPMSLSSALGKLRNASRGRRRGRSAQLTEAQRSTISLVCALSQTFSCLLTHVYLVRKSKRQI